jgi:hypothetical protein
MGDGSEKEENEDEREIGEIGDDKDRKEIGEREEDDWVGVAEKDGDMVWVGDMVRVVVVWLELGVVVVVVVMVVMLE